MLVAESGGDAHIESDSRVKTGHVVDHSSAGAIHAFSRHTMALPIAFAIAGHHAGLADKTDLLVRLKEKAGRLLEARRSAIPASVQDRALPSALPHRNDVLALEFWTRMVFSALVDADFLDTELWFGKVNDRSKARVQARVAQAPDLDELSRRLDRHLTALPRRGSAEVSALRERVLSACRRAGADPILQPGHFSLTVPTGGGKTLSSLAFALRHALQHGLRRVIVVIPFTSIIEQTADVYRRALKTGPGDEFIIEHHSALDPDDPGRETLRTRVACENWDAPIVVTTTVQFFESLFARRPSRCRKLHNIARSVVVLDEVQAIPRAFLEPILDGLNQLVRHYGTSTVLCTATQPALTTHDLPFGLGDVREIIPPAEVSSNFDLSRQRVRVEWPFLDNGPVTWDALAEDVAREPRVLAVVHLRDDARKLVEAIDRRLGDHTTRHLSALMTPGHRRRILAEIRRDLDDGGSCRVVSTQLVEAGVDIDFPVVFRALAGADSLAQAAGRCNREGRTAGGGRYRVFLAPTIPPKGVLSQGLGVLRRLLEENPALDLFEPSLYRRYFKNLFMLGEGDVEGIQSMRRDFRFKSVSEVAHLIPDVATPVAIPFCDDAKQCTRALQELRSGEFSKATLRRLQPFTVGVYDRMLGRLEQAGALEELPSHDHCIVRALRPDRIKLYDERLGLLAAEAFEALIA